jgi:hypothetical protein
MPDQEAPFAPRPSDRPRWWLPPAEESFSVYDHPRVVVLRRTRTVGIDRARELLTEGARPARAISPISATARAWQRRLSRLPVVGEGLARWFHRRERDRS